VSLSGAALAAGLSPSDASAAEVVVEDWCKVWTSRAAGLNVIRRLIMKFRSDPKGVLLLSVGTGVVESISPAVVAVVVIFAGLLALLFL
jgi:hypothetical protein